MILWSKYQPIDGSYFLCSELPFKQLVWKFFRNSIIWWNTENLDILFFLFHQNSFLLDSQIEAAYAINFSLFATASKKTFECLKIWIPEQARMINWLPLLDTYIKVINIIISCHLVARISRYKIHLKLLFFCICKCLFALLGS